MQLVLLTVDELALPLSVKDEGCMVAVAVWDIQFGCTAESFRRALLA